MAHDILALSHCQEAGPFKISTQKVISTLTYRDYAIYVAKRRTLLSNGAGKYFRQRVTYSEIAKVINGLPVRMK